MAAYGTSSCDFLASIFRQGFDILAVCLVLSNSVKVVLARLNASSALNLIAIFDYWFSTITIN